MAACLLTESTCEEWAQALEQSADLIGRVLYDGEIDEDSRATLTRLRRGLNAAAARFAEAGKPSPQFDESGQEGVDVGWLPLSARTHNALTRGGMQTIADLRRARRKGTLHRVRGVGPAALAEIEDALGPSREEKD